MKIKVEKLTHDEIVNLLSAGLYYSPWCTTVDTTTKAYELAKGDTLEDKLADILLNDGIITIIFTEDKNYILDLHYLKLGLEKYINNGGSADIINYDCSDADAVLQCAIFGEVIYG